MRMKYSESDLFDFFLGDPRRLDDSEGIMVFRTIPDGATYQVEMTISSYEGLVEISLVQTNGSVEIARFALRGIDSIEANSERCRFLSGENESGYIVRTKDYLIVAN